MKKLLEFLLILIFITSLINLWYHKYLSIQLQKNYQSLINISSELFNQKQLQELEHPKLSVHDGVKPDSRNSFLDGCHHLYIDVGTNTGLQLRKLFEPDQYPKAEILPFYDRYFGNFQTRQANLKLDPKYICAVGFEPNPKHVNRLYSLQDAYKRCGWSVNIFTQTAVSDRAGNTTFFRGDSRDPLDRTGGILADWHWVRTDQRETVRKITLSSFFESFILNRTKSVRYSNDDPKILLKLDTEGSEIEILCDMLIHGMLKHINYATIEWHHGFGYKNNTAKETKSKNLEEFIHQLSNYCSSFAEGDKTCKFTTDRMHDETYAKADLSLPTC